MCAKKLHSLHLKVLPYLDDFPIFRGEFWQNIRKQRLNYCAVDMSNCFAYGVGE